MMTPRTKTLYAADERQFSTEPEAMDYENPTSMAKGYSQVPVYKLAALQQS